MKETRRGFMKKMAAFAGAAYAVPQVFGKKEGCDKYLTYGPDPQSPPSPIIFQGWDNRPHYPVSANYYGYTTWEKKSAFEIEQDILTGVMRVTAMSNGLFIPEKHRFLIVISPSRAKFLKKRFHLGFNIGNDVETHIKTRWKNVELYCESPFLEDSGYNGSAELLVGFHEDLLDINSRSFVFSQYGI